MHTNKYETTGEYRVSEVIPAHGDMDASVYESVKEPNYHVLFIFITRIWIIINIIY